ncbi:SurA N-terminal domain-containing protein [Prauserella aidingensis]|nr:SurA N-terminal domain-containing protein [Prauserella aidingensis]
MCAKLPPVIRIMRRPIALLTALLAGLVLAGCGSGPSQVYSAAIVGDRSVPLDDVQQEIDWLLDNVPQAQQAQRQGKVDMFAREVVRGRVIHQLAQIAAKREGVTADRGEIDELIRGSGGVDEVSRSAGVEPSRVRDLASDQVVLQELARKYIGRLSVSLVGTVITGDEPGNSAKEQATALGRRIADDPERARAIARDAGHQLVDEKLDFAEALQNDPELATSAVFGSREGTVVVVQPSRQQAGWLVGLVDERRTTGQADAAEPQVNPEYLYFAGLRMLQPVAEDVGVRINPRYGLWDEAALSPAPNEDELTGRLLRSRTVNS